MLLAATKFAASRIAAIALCATLAAPSVAQAAVTYDQTDGMGGFNRSVGAVSVPSDPDALARIASAPGFEARYPVLSSASLDDISAMTPREAQDFIQRAEDAGEIARLGAYLEDNPDLASAGAVTFGVNLDAIAARAAAVVFIAAINASHLARTQIASIVASTSATLKWCSKQPMCAGAVGSLSPDALKSLVPIVRQHYHI